MFDLSIAAKLTLAVAVPTTFVLLYWLFRSDDDDDGSFSGRVTTSRQTVINLKVPKWCVGAIIGRQGASIKKIQERTGARVHFQEKNVLSSQQSDERTVTIRGSSDSAQEAELMIRQVIADRGEPITEQITVPGYTLGRIIGRSGETIRLLQKLSGAKVIIERSHDSRSPESPREVTIIGSRQAIDEAKTLIAEHVRDEEEFRAKHPKKGSKKKQHSDGDTQEQRAKVDTLTSVPVSSELWDSGSTRSDWPDKKDYLEVFVSAVEHPDHFWVQILKDKAVQLDSLTERLTAFYSTQEATENFPLPGALVGDVVAAPFDQDESWYRARVVTLDADKVDLFYVDYGDSCWVARDMLRQLRPDFLSLPFQAVECKLSNVRPKGDGWSDEAVDVFEDLTHCAHWKVLIAKTIHYVTKGDAMLPCLRLYDTNGPEDIDINLELIKRGFAEEVSEGDETKVMTSVEVDQNGASQTVAAKTPLQHAGDHIT